MKQDLYNDLGVDRNETTDEIKKTYRDAARNCHPDTGNPPDPDRFATITTAYKILRDESMREEYDRTGKCESVGFDIRREALSRLGGLFMGIINDPNFRLESTDIFEIMRTEMKKGLGEVDQKELKTFQLIEKIKAVSERVSGKDSLFNDMLKGDLQQKENVLNSLDKEKKMLEKGFEIIKDYKYKIDETQFFEMMSEVCF